MYVPHTDINQQMITESYNTEATLATTKPDRACKLAA